MIINVGGRTDIVNYYSKWLVKRLEEGFVYTRNPYNKRQVTRYDLSHDKVDAIIFCSKNYKPILDDMENICNQYNIFCYYTITSYGSDVEPNVPSIDECISSLNQLSGIVGRNRVAWRFDPLLLTQKYTVDYHLKKFEYILSSIRDDISFIVFSFVDMYKKLSRNMPEIIPFTTEQKKELIRGLASIANDYSVPIQCCAPEEGYEEYGVRKSACITKEILEWSNDIYFKKSVKENGCRKNCYCLSWRDIGEYDTCPNLCKYCYANNSKNRVFKKFNNHDENSPLLIGNIKKDDKIKKAVQKSFLEVDSFQSTLF